MDKGLHSEELRLAVCCRTPVSSRLLAAAGPQNWTFGLGQYTRSGGEEEAAAAAAAAAAGGMRV